MGIPDLLWQIEDLEHESFSESDDDQNSYFADDELLCNSEFSDEDECIEAKYTDYAEMLEHSRCDENQADPFDKLKPPFFWWMKSLTP